jgi:CheY-like chemotaxis protein
MRRTPAVRSQQTGRDSIRSAGTVEHDHTNTFSEGQKGVAAMAAHILAINNSGDILQLYKEILEDEGGYHLTAMVYKPLLIEEVKALSPDLIITDYMFREEDVGYNFVQQLKMDRDTADIPVIIVSAAVKDLREVEGHLASKDIGVLFKPFDVDELLATVERRLSETGPGRGEGVAEGTLSPDQQAKE